MIAERTGEAYGIIFQDRRDRGGGIRVWHFGGFLSARACSHRAGGRRDRHIRNLIFEGIGGKR